MLSIALMLSMAGLCRANEAATLTIKVNPAKIAQGDPFVVRITYPTDTSNTTGRALPLGAFYGKLLTFSGCGAGCYEAIGSAPIEIMPGSYTIDLNIDGDIINTPLNIGKGKFPATNITLKASLVNLSHDNRKRVQSEEAEMLEIISALTEKQWKGKFIMPLGGSHSTAFGTKRTINKSTKQVHDSLDIRGVMGSPIKASNNATVIALREYLLGGKTMILDHGHGIYSIYMHLSKFVAAQGEKVQKSQIIGVVGSTGRSTGAHLHYNIKINRQSANPVSMTSLPIYDKQIFDTQKKGN